MTVTKSSEKRIITEYSPITDLSGVGPKRREQFEKLGIYTVGDLCGFFPRAYQNRANVRLLSDGLPGISCSYMLTVSTRPTTAKLKGGMTLTKFSAFDESGKATICFFNNRFIANTFDIGQTWRFWGKVKEDGKSKLISSPIYERADIGRTLPKLTPVYRLSAGLTENIITELVGDALLLTGGCAEVIPDDLREENGLISCREAYRFIHFPDNAYEIEQARKYFAARDTFLFAVSVGMCRSEKKYGKPFSMKKTDMKPFYRSLGFEMTGAQKRSVEEIENDLVNGKYPMSRLLSGDVGSGKTAVAMAGMYICVKNGGQACLMAPTDILARQHYANIKPFFEKHGITVRLLTGSLKESEKARVRCDIANGSADIVIGTHALLTDNTVFYNPGLVITDEQHRFGVSQRAALGENEKTGITPHVLVMSATPIPRTMGLILFGDLSVSSLDELPPGRKPVKTYLVDFSYEGRLVEFIRKTVAEGGQAYVVCPSIEPEENDEDLTEFDSYDGTGLASAAETYEKLSEIFDFPVGLVHGKMKPEEKDRVMSSFAEGKTKVLVSTTVIEVGVDVKGATLMIILNAERFGLAQLHQLRGRVGRNDRQSYCVLVSDAESETSTERLKVMTRTNDGYKIAEEDLRLRGPGDYLPQSDGSARQHGDFSGITSMDFSMFEKFVKYAGEMLSSDPKLDGYPILRSAVLKQSSQNFRSMQ